MLKKNKFLKLIYDNIRKIITIISPDLTSKINYFVTFRKRLNINKPQNFNEVLMKIKILDYKSNPLVWKCSDKYELREYAFDCGLSADNFPKLLNVYDKPTDIKIEELPEQFALKLSHGCGFNYICESKSKANEKELIKLIKKWKNTTFGLISSETQYLHSKRYIYSEEYISDISGKFPDDYKIYCFDGIPKIILVCTDRKKSTKLSFFNLNWEKLDYVKEEYKTNEEISKPKLLNEMLNMAEKLSKPFKFVRIDCYQYNNKVILGEMTFTPAANCAQYYNEKANKELVNFFESEKIL